MFRRPRRDGGAEYDSLNEIRAHVKEICEARQTSGTSGWVSFNELRQWPAVQKVLNCTREEVPSRTLALARLTVEEFEGLAWNHYWYSSVRDLMSMLFRRKAPWTDDQLVDLLDCLRWTPNGVRILTSDYVTGYLTPLKHFFDGNQPSAELLERVRAVGSDLADLGGALADCGGGARKSGGWPRAWPRCWEKPT